MRRGYEGGGGGERKNFENNKSYEIVISLLIVKIKFKWTVSVILRKPTCKDCITLTTVKVLSAIKYKN